MSASEFIERLFGEIPALFRNEAELRTLWSRPDTRKQNYSKDWPKKAMPMDQLIAISRLIDADKSDLYDVLYRLCRHAH